MKRLIITAALAASPVFAETVDVFVVQKDGGVVEYVSRTTVAEADVLISGERPPNATGVVLERGKPAKWTDLPARDVNEQHGGDGDPDVVSYPDTPKGDAGDHDEESDIPEDMFPEPTPLDAARIVPRDGFWTIEIMEQIFTGCPPMLETAAREQMAALNTSGSTGIFGPDFTPNKMAPQLEWTQVNPNSWLGVLDQTSDQSGVFLQWGVQVTSPTIIENRQQMNFMVAGLGNYEVFTHVTAAWVN